MARKIFRTGNSAVVSIPPEVLEAVGLELGDGVIVTVDPEREHIVLTLATLPGVHPGFLDRVDRFIEGYQAALEAGPWQRSSAWRISPSKRCTYCTSG